MNYTGAPSSTCPKPHILFLCQCLPFPPHSGVAARSFNILGQLHKEFDITLLTFSRLSHQRDTAARDAARRSLAQLLFAVGAPVPIRSERLKLSRWGNHVRSLVSGRPYTYYEYASKDFRSQLRDAIQHRQPDLIHLDSLDLYRWIDELPPVPTFCTHHDIESGLLRRRASRVDSRVLRNYILQQARFVEQIERSVCPRFKSNLTMSALDATRLQSIAPGSRTMVVPNGVDLEYFAQEMASSPLPGRVIFVGSPTFPNRDAIEYLLQDIWPIIRAGNSAASLQLVGSFPDPDRARFENQPAVTCTGYVADIRPHVAEACCCVVPIRVGGGTRVKIIDAWAMGRPVVSTSIGCEGLKTIDGENILIHDTPKAFAEAVLKVLFDSKLRSRLGANGRKTAEQTYSWDIIGRSLCAYYRDQLQS